jgi:putative DNA primase/helicase
MICRAAAKTTAPKAHKLRSKVSSNSTVNAVVALASSDRTHAATIDQFDQDQWALATPSGVADLRTGELRPAQMSDHCSKCTAIAPDFNGKPERWLDFIEFVAKGDAPLQDFLQRMSGYGITGRVSEHALFFLWGPGGNGKGTFLNTITSILGINGYAAVANMDMLAYTKQQRHAQELAKLRGSRFVTAQETAKGRRWDETRLKVLTGGDPISANFMHKNEFTFYPQFKLFIAGNHRPVLRDVGDAIRRRFNLIPFDRPIPQIDQRFAESLKPEWGRILAWCIEGARLWHQHGLNPPESVIAATRRYLDSQNHFQQWLDERCEISFDDKRMGTKSSDLYADWCQWCQRNGEPPGTQTAFDDDLTEAGFSARKVGVIYRIGIRLRPGGAEFSADDLRFEDRP